MLFVTYHEVSVRSLNNTSMPAGKGGYTKSTGAFMSTKNSNDWERQFNSLLEYRSIHGSCDVPVKTEKYKSLGRWVSAQRKKYRQYISKNTTGSKPGYELVQRFQRLKDIGFNFAIGSGNSRKHKSTAKADGTNEAKNHSNLTETGV